MAFIEKHEGIAGEVVNKARGRLPGRKVRQMPRIVFNALAKAHLIEHFKVKKRSLLQTCRFDFLAGRPEFGKPLLKLRLNRTDCVHDLVSRSHVVTCGVHDKARHLLAHLAR